LSKGGFKDSRGEEGRKGSIKVENLYYQGRVRFGGQKPSRMFPTPYPLKGGLVKKKNWKRGEKFIGSGPSVKKIVEKRKRSCGETIDEMLRVIA